MAVTLRDATKVWGYIGVNSFGGPAGQISVMHREVVDARRWIDERRFLHALNYCMVLPGPEAQQLSTYIGWLMNGVRGGLVAGSLFVLPGFVVMLVLSAVYAEYGDVRWVAGLLFGLQAAVVAIVVQAMVRLGGRTLHSPLLRLLAVAAFVALFFFAVPFPIVIIVAGLMGLVVGRRRPQSLPGFPDDDTSDETLPPVAAKRALLTAAALLVLWLLPVVLLVVFLGSGHVLSQIAVLFSKAAVVTFGGAYAVLSYVSQEAVVTYGWISAQDMTTGLGLAETTPGPLIMVVEFIGFLAAFNNPGTLPPMVAGLAGAVIAVWATFVPCFMFIFGGAPYVDRLRHNRSLHHALSAVSAAVVGVIGNLALWFALSTFFEVSVWRSGPLTVSVPDLGTLDLAAVLIAGVAALLVFWRRWPTLQVLGVCAGLGLVIGLV